MTKKPTITNKSVKPADSLRTDGALPLPGPSYGNTIEYLRARAFELIQAGAIAPRATLAQRFAAGDLVNALDKLVKDTTGTPSDRDVADAPQDSKEDPYSALRNWFMSEQGGAVSREVLKTYGRMAATWKVDDPVRGGRLSYSHLRLLSQGKEATRRSELLERTERESLSTGDLQRLIRGETGVAECVYSQAPITDFQRSAELRVNPAALKPGILVPALAAKRRGGASKKKHANLDEYQGNGDRLLRFADAHALLAWLSENIDSFIPTTQSLKNLGES